MRDKSQLCIRGKPYPVYDPKDSKLYNPNLILNLQIAEKEAFVY